jgi:hypothetical protein
MTYTEAEVTTNASTLISVKEKGSPVKPFRRWDNGVLERTFASAKLR